MIVTVCSVNNTKKVNIKIFTGKGMGRETVPAHSTSEEGKGITFIILVSQKFSSINGEQRWLSFSSLL